MNKALETCCRTVFRVLACLGVAAGLAACGGGGDYNSGSSSAAPAATESITVRLTGEQEAPAAIASGAFGNATFELNRSASTLQGTVTVDGMAATVAHIHAGEAGVAGAIVFPMMVQGNTATLASTTLTAAQLADLDAGKLYVNVHSAANKSGEIRGQIGREVYRVLLDGMQKPTPVATQAKGEGLLVLDAKTGDFSGEIELTGITATAADIRAGAAGVSGAKLIDLQDHGGHGHFEVAANTKLTAAQMDNLRAGRWYVNVQSAVNPNGEIRGQIARRVIVANAGGAQEVPANNSAASAKGIVVYDPLTRGTEARLVVAGMDATVAHIHMAAAGSNGPIAVALTRSATDPAIWASATDLKLTAEQALALLSGGLYFNAHSATFDKGEVRGQIVAP
jgi:riboflavin synthase alpha subunit